MNHERTVWETETHFMQIVDLAPGCRVWRISEKVLLCFMYAKPIVSVGTVVAGLKMNFSSANRLLKSLTELGVLKEITGFSRNRLFVLEEYLALFRS